MTGAVVALDPTRRKAVLRVLFVSLLLDLISFTFILPLFPSLLSFYRDLDTGPASVLNRIIHYLNAYKRSFSIPVNPRYDIVLLGGALGSLFSFLQAIASPIIGRASDRYGRRRALLWSMAGNIASVALWCAATDFRTFLLSRVVGGLSEGNVQLATAIATDISDESQRGSTMALVGACFSIAFTFGPALGAGLANITLVAANPFAAAAGFSLLLILVETVYLYLYLPETRPPPSPPPSSSSSSPHSAPAPSIPPVTQNGPTVKKKTTPPRPSNQRAQTNPAILLNLTHLLFLLPFSGLEFSLPFLLSTTLYPTHPSPAKLNGRLLGFIGLVASMLQGSIVRRLPPLSAVRIGVASCALAFFLLARTTTATTITTTPSSSSSPAGLYLAATLLAVTSATVVTGLNGLASFEAADHERGKVLGALRSWGQFGRALGPLVFCTLFWWAGRELAYSIGGVCMLLVAGLVFGLLTSPAASPVPFEK